MFGLKQMVMEPVAKPTASKMEAINEQALQEYEKIVIEAGYQSYNLTIQKFKAFLKKNDIPTFNLQEVIKYMDYKAIIEGKNRWGWKTLLPEQHDSLGRRQSGWNDKNCHFKGYHYNNGSYKLAVPRRALEKVIAIRKAFGYDVMFLVSDYDLKPDFIERGPDPFLMAIVPNPEIKRGVGQFVIDFWDEPGFGLEQQLA